MQTTTSYKKKSPYHALTLHLLTTEPFRRGYIPVLWLPIVAQPLAIVVLAVVSVVVLLEFFVLLLELLLFLVPTLALLVVVPALPL